MLSTLKISTFLLFYHILITALFLPLFRLSLSPKCHVPSLEYLQGGIKLCIMPKQIPSPRAMPFIGNLLDVISDDVPTRALERMADEYGPIYKLTIKGVDRIIVANHALFSELCDETRFCKTAGPGLAALNRGKGPPGLFTASSEKDPDWAQAHRILMPAFGPMSVRNMFVGKGFLI